MLIDWTPLPRYVVIEYAFKSSLRDYICTFIGPDHALQKKIPLRKSGQLRALWIQCAADATTALPPSPPCLACTSCTACWTEMHKIAICNPSCINLPSILQQRDPDLYQLQFGFFRKCDLDLWEADFPTWNSRFPLTPLSGLPPGSAGSELNIPEFSNYVFQYFHKVSLYFPWRISVWFKVGRTEEFDARAYLHKTN